MGLFHITRSHFLGKYLGCPTFQGKPKQSTFQELVSTAMSKMKGELLVCLKQVEQYLFSPILSPFQHIVCSILVFPGNQLERLIKSLETFSERSLTQAEAGLPLTAWEKICRPKLMGGLGLRKNQSYK